MTPCIPSNRGLSTSLTTGIAIFISLTAGHGGESNVAHTARINTARLQLVIADNEAYGAEHKGGYNGVAELRLQPDDPKNLFVPNYAGLNLEHIFSGDTTSYGWNIFEPRRFPIQLIRHATNRVELRQEKTEHWPLRSRLVFDVQEDVIDLTYYGTPLADRWQKHGYIGVFFASYLNAPEDMAIQFIGRSRPGRGDAQPRWIKHLPAKHGVAANHRPAGSSWDPPLDGGFNIDLLTGISDFEYLYPFYFGRFGDNVLVLMFERIREGGELRFASSPSGGGKGNPAWDFVYFRHDYAINREFSFRVRAVYRRFAGVEDVARWYEDWSGEKVKLPPL
jgi:hypothetical protein